MVSIKSISSNKILGASGRLQAAGPGYPLQSFLLLQKCVAFSFPQKRISASIPGAFKNCRTVLFLLIISALFFQAPKTLGAQTAGPVSLSSEIAAIEEKLKSPKLPAAERKSALESMARLHELSGDVEAAADAWLAAARAVPASGHEATLRGARCLAAIGEFDKASALLPPVLAVSGNQPLRIKAMLLNAQLGALTSGDTSALGGLLLNPDFVHEKPALYYSIWMISSDPAVRATAAARLASECPHSPEARIVRNDTPVAASPSALWLLLGVQEAAVTSAASPALPAGVSSSGFAPDRPEPALAVPDGSREQPTMLQTGLFTMEENAKNRAKRLQTAGFSPVIAKKTINGKEHWAVGVLPGSNPSLTMLLLKDKGFESFPVY
jgi:hypothetical protein